MAYTTYGGMIRYPSFEIKGAGKAVFKITQMYPLNATWGYNTTNADGLEVRDALSRC